MDWQEALEIVIGRTGRDAYRWACSEARHDHMAWRTEMIRQASGEPPPAPPSPPPMPFTPVIPDAFRRGWRSCLYSSWTPTGCCGGALTCHWKGEAIPLSTCVGCVGEMS